MSADAPARRPEQVLFALRPAGTVTAPFQNGLDGACFFTRPVPPAFPRRSCFPTIGPIGGLAMPVTVAHVISEHRNGASHVHGYECREGSRWQF